MEKKANVFLGVAEPKDRGAIGVHKAILAACSATLDKNTEADVLEDEEALLAQSKKVFQHASLFVTLLFKNGL
jgi:hypothetical protein